MSKKLLWILLPIIAVGSPPVVYNARNWWAQARQRVAPLLSLATGGDGTPVPGKPLDPLSPTGPGAFATADGGRPASADKRQRPHDTPVQLDPAEVLRFEVTPAWVMERWPWVCAGLSQLPLQGYRVPLVTGTASDDLAGSLTYYFNSRQMVEQITFDGTTGDPSKLLRVLIGNYGFGRRLTNDPGLFRYEVPELRGPAKSYLNVRLVQPNDAYRRYQVDLVMLRPQ